MSGLVITICWGLFIFGLVELPRQQPHTDDYNSLLILVVFSGILGPGMTGLIIINACWKQRRQEKNKSLLSERVYIVV
jgi:hypothetical protein